MARTPRSARPPQNPGPTTPGSEGAPPLETTAIIPDTDGMDDNTWRAMVELGEQAEKILLHRRYPNGRYGFMTEYLPDDFSLLRVRDEFGPGEYLAQYIDQEKRQTGRASFMIDAPPKKEEPSQPVVAQAPGFDGIREILQQQTELIRALLEKSQIAAKTPQHDPFDMAIRLAEVLRPNERPERSFSEVAEIFKAGVDLAARAEKGDEGYSGVIEKFAPPVLSILESAARGRNGGSRPPPPRVAPPPSPNQPAPEPQPTMDPNAPSWMVHLQPHIPTLLGWARMGKDPELYAAVILDNLDPGAALEVEEAAQADDFVEKTFAALPMFKPYSAWAKSILQHIKDQTKREAVDPDDLDAGTG